MLKALALISLFSLVLANVAQAGGHFGLFFGAGSLKATGELYNQLGGGRSSTREGLLPGDSVIRDAKATMYAWTVGLQTGYMFGQHVGLEARAKYVVNYGGEAQHYFRGTTTVIGVEDADFDYYGGSVDVGVRLCAAIFCLRPYIGSQVSTIQKFNFGNDSKSHFARDEGPRRRILGGQFLVELSKSPGSTEIGLDYYQYPSSLGGFTHVLLLTVGGLIKF